MVCAKESIFRAVKEEKAHSILGWWYCTGTSASILGLFHILSGIKSIVSLNLGNDLF